MSRDDIWVVFEHYGDTIHSIHKTKKEATIALAFYKKYYAGKKGTTPRSYEKHNGVIGEIRRYRHDKLTGQYLRFLRRGEEP